MLQFLLSGLRSGERAACFSEHVSRSRIDEFFQQNGISCTEAIHAGTLTLAPPRDIYFADNRFDPDRMLHVLKQYYTETQERGYSAARVIGEMLPEVQNIAGGDRLLEYESKVSILLRKCPVTAVCQYDARHFSGAVIMDILKVHPLMVVRGAVVNNPFFIPPEEFLAQ